MHTEDLATALPKIDLHCHLTGSVPAHVVLSSAAKHGIETHTTDPDLFYGGARRRDNVKVWTVVREVLRDAEDFYNAAYYSSAEPAQADNLRYRELMVNFLAHEQFGIPIDSVLNSVVHGLTDAYHQHGVRTRIIALFDRWNEPEDVRTCMSTLLEKDCPDLVGIGIAGWEADNPPRAFEEAYRLARENGLHATAHAGERGPAQWVAEAVDVLGCDRIDHGYYTLLDEAITARMRDLQIPFTACWTTTNRQGWDTAQPPHIIRRMMQAGLQVSLHSDDPATFATTLGQEHRDAVRGLDLTPEEITTLSLNAADAAWAPDDEKEQLRLEIEAASNDAVSTNTFNPAPK